MKMHTQRNRLAGLSLIELLVAIALGGLLMGGAISLFVNNRATYEVTNDMARLQENARFTLQLLTQDIRMAGYTGCLDEVSEVNDLIGEPTGALANFSFGIEGYEQGGTDWLPTNHVGQDDAIIAGSTSPLYNAFMADSDGITVRYLQSNLSQAGTDFNNEVTNISPSDANETNPNLSIRNLTHSFVDGQTAGVADCGGVDVFTVNGDTPVGSAFVAADALSRSWQVLNRAIVSPFVGVRYFVRLNAAGNPALFRSTIDPDDAGAEETRELVDGVQSLQILYRGSNGGYTDATATDFRDVIAVKVAMLLRTNDGLNREPDDNVYEVGTERFCRAGLVANPVCTRTYPADNRRRRVFQTTIFVRNAL